MASGLLPKGVDFPVRQDRRSSRGRTWRATPARPGRGDLAYRRVRHRLRHLGVIALVGLLTLAASAFGEERSAPRGLYALSTNIQPISDTLYASLVQGVSLRGGWRDFEPREDRFVWHFDRELEKAKRASKTVMLRVAADYRTPDWVWEAGAQRFQLHEKSAMTRTQGQAVTIPVPGDAVFQAKWKRFIAALGERYSGDPAVVLVHMTLASRYGAEMNLATAQPDKERWRQLGYSKTRLVEAWHTIIDAYAEAFPRTYLAIDVAMPLFDDGAVEDVLAYGTRRLGKRFAVQHNALHATTRETKTPHRWVVGVKGRATIGFQLLEAASAPTRRFGGTMAEAVKIALAAGASYLEIYPADLSDPESLSALEEAARRLGD